MIQTNPNSYGALPESPGTGKRFRVARLQHEWYQETDKSLRIVLVAGACFALFRQYGDVSV